MAEEIKVDTRWFQDKLGERELSQRRFAKLLGLDPAAVSLILNGKRKVSTSEAANIANILGIPVNEILTRLGDRALSGASKAGIVGIVDDHGRVKPKKSGVVVDAPVQLADNAVALRNEDPSSYFFGWTYFYSPRNDIGADTIGRMCVVKYKDGSQAIRFPRPGLEPNTFILTPLVGAPETGEIVAASRVMWIKA